MDCTLPGSSVHWDSPGKNTGVGCHTLLQGIFPTQELNPGLLHCRQFSAIWATREAPPGGASGKEPTCQCRRGKRCGFDPWVRKIPWRRAWQPTPIFLLGASHGQRSLVGDGWLKQFSMHADRQSYGIDPLNQRLTYCSKGPLVAARELF